MTEFYPIFLILNGSIIVFIGLITGLPLRSAIVKKRNELINPWRATHTVLITDGILVIIVGLIISRLLLNDLEVELIAWSLVISGYSFVVAFIVGSWKRVRGLTPMPFGLNTLLFVFHFIGAAGSLVAVALIIYGSLRNT